MNSSAKRVLILGGTGFVGRHVCEKLTRMGCSMTVITRRASQAAAIQNLPRVRVLEGDVYNGAFLATCMAHHDVVINLIAILHGSETAFNKAHVQLPQVIAQACLASGVKRLIHISALGASLDGPSNYQRSKAQGEAVLQQAGLDLTLFNPASSLVQTTSSSTCLPSCNKLHPPCLWPAPARVFSRCGWKMLHRRWRIASWMPRRKVTPMKFADPKFGP